MKTCTLLDGFQGTGNDNACPLFVTYQARAADGDEPP